MISWYLNLALWKKILYPVLLVIVIVLIIIFVPKYDKPQKNCIFLNEKANLHGEYYITVTDFKDCDNIEILKNKDDEVKTKLFGTDKHFISVTILLEHINVANPNETKPLKPNTFKLKDHTGVQIGNFNFGSKNDGLALSKKDFSTTDAIEDYSWVDTLILPGEKKTITIYFEVEKDISTNNTITVLESDLFSFLESENHLGTDIVLAQRIQ